MGHYRWIDLAMNGVFICEAAVRIIAHTFWHGDGSYLSVPSQRLDFFIVLCPMLEYVSVFIGIGAFPNLKPLRAFRTLRVLRAVRFLTYFSHILEALSNAFPRYIHLLPIITMYGRITLFYSLTITQVHRHRHGASLPGCHLRHRGGPSLQRQPPLTMPVDAAFHRTHLPSAHPIVGYTQARQGRACALLCGGRVRWQSE